MYPMLQCNHVRSLCFAVTEIFVRPIYFLHEARLEKGDSYTHWHGQSCSHQWQCVVTNILEEHTAAIFTSAMKTVQCDDPQGHSLKLTDIDTLTFEVSLSKAEQQCPSSLRVASIYDGMDLSRWDIVCGFVPKSRHSSKKRIKFSACL
jgi:hypothetical protein